MSRVGVALVLVDDPVYLPRVVGPLLADPRIALRAAFLVPLTSARSAHPAGARGPRSLLARAALYGLPAFAGLAALQLVGRLRGILTRRTLAGLARRQGVRPSRWRRSVNAPELSELVRRSGAEVVLGVFSERAGEALRHATPGGLVLLHYALLPRFAGREPTFWTLLQAPEAGGVTFFRADASLDGGAVAAAAACGLTSVRSLHQAFLRLSDAAGGVAADAVCAAARGRLEPQQGAPERRGWPTRADVRAFRARGLRFL